mmetsp:Transcript_22207/g.21433  ORF Transcript_22207/g.21433 Transcript_22207/m.21433 type:complete len:127 (-) Transcript_22207:132-512(-)
MNKVCKVSINKATEYGIIRKNLPTSISNILTTLFERTNPLIFKYPVHTGIHQYIRNISGSAEVTDVFGKVVAGSWSGNNQIHNLQIEMLSVNDGQKSFFTDENTNICGSYDNLPPQLQDFQTNRTV